MKEPMTGAERRAHNQRRHAEERREFLSARGDQGVTEMWFDHARKIARERAEAGDAGVWADLALTLSNWCKRYGGST